MVGFVSKRARRIAIAVTAILVLAGIWLLRAAIGGRGRGTLRSTVEQQAQKPMATISSRLQAREREQPSASAKATTAPEAGAPRVVPTAATPTAGPGTRVSVIQQTAAEYRRRARYPRSSQPLVDGEEDPLLRDRAVSHNVTHGAEGEPFLTVFPDQVSFEDPEPVVIYAYLSVGETPVPASDIGGAVTDQQGTVVAPLTFRDDGAKGDAVSDDFVYTAALQPSETRVGGLKGAYAVSVHAQTADGQARFGTTGFLYSHPDAQLTGRYTDAVVNGNLQVSAQLAVAAEGRFHLEATLYSQAGRPLAWAQNALQLSPGEHWMPLSFFGLILRERGEDGPYTLRFVALSTTTEMPNAKNRLVENAYVTAAYPVTVFSDQPFNDPNLIETADRMERDAPPDGPSLETGH